MLRLAFDVKTSLFPRQNAALHVVDVGETLFTQVIGDLAAAITTATGDNNLFVGRQLGNAGWDVAHGDEGDIGDVASVIFVLLTHVEEENVFVVFEGVGGLNVDCGGEGGGVDNGRFARCFLTILGSASKEAEQEEGDDKEEN